MGFSKNDLIKLKGQIKSIDDLKEIADNYNISTTQSELEEAYKFILEDETNELDIDDLNHVTGGAQENQIETTWVSCSCGFKMEITCDSQIYYCPQCNKPHQYKKAAKKRSLC